MLDCLRGIFWVAGMVSTNEFKKNHTKLLVKGEPWVVLDFSHVKPGKGGAFVKTKLRNLRSGVIYEESFRSGEKIQVPDLESRKMQYLYADSMYHFMDLDSFEQMSFSKKEIEEEVKYLQPEQNYEALYFNKELIEFLPPMFLNLKVVETVPGVRGNTAQGSASKPATLETGLVLAVPLFVEEGDVIKVDTRDRKYIERLSKTQN